MARPRRFTLAVAVRKWVNDQLRRGRKIEVWFPNDGHKFVLDGTWKVRVENARDTDNVRCIAEKSGEYQRVLVFENRLAFRSMEAK